MTEAERRSMPPRVASVVYGIPLRAIQQAYLSGELTAYYRSPRRPVLFAEDIEAWIKSSPTERATA